MSARDNGGNSFSHRHRYRYRRRRYSEAQGARD